MTDDADDGDFTLGEEAERAVRSFADLRRMALLMAYYGVTAVGVPVANTLIRLYYFELAAKTCIRARSTRKPLGALSPEVAELTARL